MILCVHEHFHVNSESPLSCFGWGFLEGGAWFGVVLLLLGGVLFWFSGGFFA